jgi:hypothetical protein
MRNVALTLTILGTLVPILAAAPARAQATRTYVSGTGIDNAVCSRTAPCKTFAGAIAATVAGGEISILDAGGYGSVTITKSISIINDYSGEAGIVAAGVNGITITTGLTDVVVLRGLVITGDIATKPGLNGISFTGGGALHVDKCLIKNFHGAAPNGIGLNFAPSIAGQLFVSDTVLIGNGSGTNGHGIRIAPSGSGSAKVAIERVRAENNTVGIEAIATATSGVMYITIRDTLASGNSLAGFSAVTPASAQGINMMISNSAAVNNGSAGITASGAKALVMVGNATVTGNNFGLSFASGAQLQSYGNNAVNLNIVSDGAPSAKVGGASTANGQI